jgi:hypothetical protein
MKTNTAFVLVCLSSAVAGWVLGISFQKHRDHTQMSDYQWCSMGDAPNFMWNARADGRCYPEDRGEIPEALKARPLTDYRCFDAKLTEIPCDGPCPEGTYCTMELKR